MPNYVHGSTIRLSQLTGNYDPENKYHFNFTEEWKCMGVDLGASTEHDDATFIFFGDAVVSGIDNRMLADKLFDTDPIAFIEHPQFLAGAGVAANYQSNTNKTVAFFMDGRGRLYVNWSVSGGDWVGPVRISRSGVSFAGAELATAHQVNDDQLDVFFIDRDGRVSVSWTKKGVDNEKWQGPQQIGYNDLARTKPGGCLTAAYQFDPNQLDAFFY
ncbi:MAG: hypothetical protein ABIQ88_00185 [Chitinophagaceae bacterium]